MKSEPAEAVLSPNPRLLFHVAALSLEVKALQAEVDELKAKLATLEGDRAE